MIRKNTLPALLSIILLTSATSLQAQTIIISGTVYDDGNGGTIDGTPVGSIPGASLYIYAVNNSNTIVAKAAVSNNGIYSATVNANANYNISLSSGNYPVGQTNANLGLPNSYMPTAEGVTVAGDGLPDYGVAINSNTNLTINFAFDARPQGLAYTITSPAYSSNGRVIIPADAFNGNDAEDGAYPTGFAGRSIDLYQAIGGTLYYNNAVISFASASTATRISNFNVNLLSFELNNAASGHAFAYSLVDNAGITELVPNTISIGFPLPVRLQSFAGRCHDDNVLLNWETATETGNEKFLIERRTGGSDFMTIGEVRTKAPGGQSAITLAYDFRDNDLPAGAHLYYRLRQLDISGKTTYSPVVALNNTAATAAGFSIGPTPSTGTLNAVFTLTDSPFNVSVVNQAGSIVYSKSFPATALPFTTSLDLSALANGEYMIRFSNSEVAVVKKVLIRK